MNINIFYKIQKLYLYCFIFDQSNLQLSKILGAKFKTVYMIKKKDILQKKNKITL